MSNSAFAPAIALSMLALGACAEPRSGAVDSRDAEPDQLEAVSLTRAQLLDPETCKGCHPDHYRQWASSMHAYAATDPVFLAMNRRGQRETKGQLGDFCVKCHAPMAVREGATTDGLNLEQLPAHLKGVSCYFCHNVTQVAGAHGNQLTLANDTTMRAGLSAPRPTSAHASAYSELHDGLNPGSASVCGSCHDVMTPSGVHLERAYRQWSQSLYGRTDQSGSTSLSCSACHMPSYRGSSVPGGEPRSLHEHLWPGVDTALTDFPDKAVQKAAIDCALASAVTLQICPSRTGEFEVSLAADVAHRWPTGSAQHRRAWLELVAYDENEQVMFASGLIADGQPVAEPGQHVDPAYACGGEQWVMRDYMYKADGAETHMFWEAAPSGAHPLGYEECTLPAPERPNFPHDVRRSYRFATIPSRVEARVQIRPLGLEVIDDLIASGDLAPAHRSALPTHTLLGTVTTWRKEDGFASCASTPRASPLVCPDAYRCLLRPEAPECAARTSP